MKGFVLCCLAVAVLSCVSCGREDYALLDFNTGSGTVNTDPPVQGVPPGGGGGGTADPNTFGIFSDKVSLDVVWDSTVFLRVWTDFSAGCVINDVASTSPDGGLCWEITGTGVWVGIGIEPDVHPSISSYSNLVFHYKGTKNFKVGIKSGSSTERWVQSSAMVTSYGLALDGDWHVVKIPFTAFAGIDFSDINQYFMFVADSGLGYVVGDKHYLDCLHFSRE